MTPATDRRRGRSSRAAALAGLLLAGACGSVELSRAPEARGLGLALASPASTAADSGAVTEAASPVRELHGVRLEEVLHTELADLRRRDGDRGLELLARGSDRVSRLRYALSRVQLQRVEEATEELRGLVAEIDDPLALLWLGQLESATGDPAAAVVHLERAMAAEASRRLDPHPELPIALAQALRAAGRGEEGEQLLRRTLADGPDRIVAAHTLSRWMLEHGRFVDSLAILDSVLEDFPEDSGLLLDKVVLLADMQRIDDARALLHARREVIGAVLVGYHEAQLLRRQSRFAEALAELERLRAGSASDPITPRDGEALDLLADELGQEQRAGRRLWMNRSELLGVLRFDPSPVARLTALRELAAQVQGTSLQAALVIAVEDGDEAVRADVFRTMLDKVVDPGVLVRAGLADASAVVRGAAARAAAGAAADGLVAMLLDALEREESGYAFRIEHDALRKLTGAAGPALPFQGEEQADVRRRVAAGWRRSVGAAGSTSGDGSGS